MKRKPFNLKNLPPVWRPVLHEYVQYRDASGSEWMDARVSQITTHTITVFVFKFRIAHQINKFTMKNYIKKIRTALDKFEGLLDEAAEGLKEKIEFDFIVTYNANIEDIVIEHDDSCAPLDDCIALIKKKGKLTLEDYDSVIAFRF